MLDQASDLALHSILDVATGVEAYRRVVGCADYLALVINVRCCHKWLSSSIVSCANWFIFLVGEEGSKDTTEAVTRYKDLRHHSY